MERDPLRLLALYYAATGIWPLVHLGSFMFLTGRKHDTWLVKTFGLLIGALGVGLLPRQGAERRAQERVALLASGALALAETVFVARRRISPIYLADALVEVALAAHIARYRDGRDVGSSAAGAGVLPEAPSSQVA